MKKVISIFLACLVLTTGFCLSCYSASYFSSKGFLFLPTDDNNAIIYGYTGASENVVIPEKLIGYNVTAIADNAFSNKTSIKSISFENAIYLNSIGASAFSGCTSLKSVELTPSIKQIGQSAFQNCQSIESLSFGTVIKNIPEQAFYGCSSLVEIEIPDNVTTIGSYAFGNCSSLRKATVSYMVSTINNGAFIRDDKLTIFCYENTIAKDYAINNNIPYVCINGKKNFDFDGNDRVDIRDATLMQKYIVELVFYDKNDLVLADNLDVNNDGSFNIADVTSLQKKLVGLED